MDFWTQIIGKRIRTSSDRCPHVGTTILKIVQGPPAYIDNHQEEADAPHLPKKKQSHKTRDTTVVLLLGAPMSTTNKTGDKVYAVCLQLLQQYSFKSNLPIQLSNNLALALCGAANENHRPKRQV